jgi:anti-sigma B factor antagonist
MDQMSLASRREGDRIVIVVAGEIDMATVADLNHAARNALAGPDVAEVGIDLSMVTFVDSTGLGALAEINAAAAAQNKMLILLRPGTQVRKLLRMTNVESILTIEH